MKKKIVIVGSGPSALMLAALLDESRFEVHIFEKNAAPARKFLVAGDGGFNLTHSEDIRTMLTRYTPKGYLDEALLAFPNTALMDFLASIGVPVFTGTSKRVFPEKGIKPVDVLNAFLSLLKKKNVSIHLRQEWEGRENGALLFRQGENLLRVNYDYAVFALGGASWPVTGSTGSWTEYFIREGIKLNPFMPSNCLMLVRWPEAIREKFAGAALKNIAVACKDVEKKGELVLTAEGLEGGAVYFHSPSIREQLQQKGSAEIFLDFRPGESAGNLFAKLQQSREPNMTSALRKTIRLSPLQIVLLKTSLSKEDFSDKMKVATRIRQVPVQITGTGPIEDAISTAGGIATEETDAFFQLKKMPGHFVLGEMIDWDAPTGGYLLQACFSMGAWLARNLNMSANFN